MLNASEQAKNDVDCNGNQLTVTDAHTAAQTKTDEEVVYKRQYAWFNIIGFVYLHYGWLVGLSMLWPDAKFLFSKDLIKLNYYFCKFFTLKISTVVVVGVLSGWGITAGTHRLWAHGAYKANLKLRIMLAFFQTVAFQNSIYEWSRDHRVHHKFTDSNADPHNA